MKQLILPFKITITMTEIGFSYCYNKTRVQEMFEENNREIYLVKELLIEVSATSFGI